MLRNKRIRSSALSSAVAGFCEPLEIRRLLSTINWTNKGTGAGAGDTDSFNAIYGANATVARNIVQRAIDDWERVIVNFNYSGGGNTYNVNITAAAISGRGATGINTQLGGKPTSASIQLDDNGGGEGWYFDPNIGSSTLPDDSEFTNLITPFNASFTGVGAANDDDDYYRTIAHELGHAMGISGGSALLLDDNFTNIGADPLDAGSSLFAWNINGGAVEATFTNNTGIHFYEGPTVPAGGTIHPNELLNPGRTVGAPPTERQLISDLTATVLRDAYNYTVTLPSTINTFQANLNTATNRLTINGLAGTTNETITLNTSGANQVIAVTGTTETIPTAQISTIVVEASGGNDSIFINDLPDLTARATLNGGAGNDTFHIGGGDYDTNIGDFIEVNGDAGTDRVEFEDINDTLDDSYLLGSLFFSKSSSSFNVDMFTVEGVQIEGSDTGNNTLSLTGVAAGRPVTLLGNGGNDTFNLGSSSSLDATFTDDVSVNGGAGTDSIVLDDTAETTQNSYSIGTATLFRTGSTGGLTFTATEDITLDAGTGGDLAQMGGTLSGVTFRLNSGGGADEIQLGSDLDTNFNGTFVGNGGSGTDSITFTDTGDALDDGYTITGTAVNKSPLAISISYSLFEDITLEANPDNNAIQFGSVGSGQTLRLNGLGGNDTFSLLANDINTQIGGSVFIAGGAGTTDAVNLIDSGDATADAYTITGNTFQVTAGVLSGLITYSTVETFDFTGNNQPTAINVNAAASNVAYTLNGADGDDTFNFGNGDFDNNIDSTVTINGGAGIDRLRIDDTGDTLDDSYNITGTSFAKSSGTGAVSYSTGLFLPPGVEQFVLDASEANNTINVIGLGTSSFAIFPNPPTDYPTNATLNGNGGDDTINLATGGNLGAIRGNVNVVGGAGVDAVNVNDSADGTADSFSLTNVNLTNSNWDYTLSYANTNENFTLEGGTGNNTITNTSTFGGTTYRLNGNNGVDTFDILGNNVAVIVDGGAGLDNVSVNADAVGTASARFINNQDLNALVIGTGGLVSQNTGKLLLDTQTTTISGRLDLSDGGFIDRAVAAEATYRPRLVTGYAAGAWTTVAQPAIFSTAAAGGSGLDALGYGFAGQVGAVSFFGSPVAAGDFLIRYTLYGDADLSGSVNLDDFTRLAAQFGLAGNWSQGNSDYDLDVDLDDFTALAATFGLSVPSDAPRAAAGLQISTAAPSTSPFSDVGIGENILIETAELIV